MRTRKRLAGYCAGLLALACTFAVLTAQVQINSAGGDLARSGNETIAGSDTLLTSAIQTLAATTIVFVLSCSTGTDSAVVPQVSQDGVHWRRADLQESLTQAANGSDAVTWAYVSTGDSLSLARRTGVLCSFIEPTNSVGGSATLIPFPYRFARLKIYGKVGKVITDLIVIAQPIGVPADLSNVYSVSW